MVVYRIQPQGSDLHGQRSITSNDQELPGVFVFETLAEAWACREWLNEKKVELVTIKCELCDLRRAGDYEGALLLQGRGQIIKRRKFKDVKTLAKWIELGMKS